MGIVDNHGFGEGEFREGTPYHERRFLDAMKHVMTQIDGVIMRSEFTTLRIYNQSLFVDEFKARECLEYCVTNISGAEEFIQLLDSMYGQIQFWRKVRFNGWTKSRREELVGEIRKFGYEPKDDWETDNARHYFQGWKGSEETRQELRAKFERARTNQWLEKLEFH